MQKPESIQENESQISQRFWNINWSRYTGQKNKPRDSLKELIKEPVVLLVNFGIPLYHRVKIKQNEKRDKL